MELAKSYMHKRPTSPSMLGLRSQALKENSIAIYTRNLTSPSKFPIAPLVPRTSGHIEARENSIITPRSRGRSAIYSMARTPYSRVHPNTTFKVCIFINLIILNVVSDRFSDYVGFRFLN